MKANKLLVLIPALILTACGRPETVAPNWAPLVGPKKLYAAIERSNNVIIPTYSESTPVVLDGQLLLVSFDRTTALQTEIRDKDGNLIHAYPEIPYSFGCAFVEGSRLYVFGILGDDHSHISMTYSDDLITWAPSTEILTAGPGQDFYNSSVTKTDTGYVIAYEMSEPDINGYSFRFAKSGDLKNWSSVGVLFSHDYSACPTIRYINGVYYILFLGYSGASYTTTWAARTTDLANFELSPYIVLAPIAGEGTNASDVDLVEFNGVTYLYYLDGNQADWDDLKLATYEGSEEQLFKSLF